MQPTHSFTQPLNLTGPVNYTGLVTNLQTDLYATRPNLYKHIVMHLYNN